MFNWFFSGDLIENLVRKILRLLLIDSVLKTSYKKIEIYFII